jgi:hypothetical protein
MLGSMSDGASELKKQFDSLSTEALRNIAYPPALIDPMSFRMPELPKMKSMWEVQAELFMEGLQNQAQELETSLKPDEELVMTCWHGNEKFHVLSVSMPSQNVVALRCVDAEGNQIQMTGHMHAVTFSFMVCKTQPPAERNKIGFAMP